jgi:CspA family cold shock protein
VTWYNAIKGFGFIVADRGGKDIFAHATALERSGIMGLAETQRVAVEWPKVRKDPRRSACD